MIGVKGGEASCEIRGGVIGDRCFEVRNFMIIGDQVTTKLFHKFNIQFTWLNRDVCLLHKERSSTAGHLPLTMKEGILSAVAEAARAARMRVRQCILMQCDAV